MFQNDKMPFRNILIVNACLIPFSPRSRAASSSEPKDLFPGAEERPPRSRAGRAVPEKHLM